MCGHNQALAARLRRAGLAHVYGWVADMSALMAAADVLVQNAGGLSSLEAFAGGLPVVGYRCIPGHGQTNAAALHEAGLAYWIRESADLEPVLTELLDGTLGRQQRDRGLALFGARPGGGHRRCRTPDGGRSVRPDPGPDAPHRTGTGPARCPGDGGGHGHAVSGTATGGLPSI
ncbi:hypothetical protein [Streptomyces sp. CA2R101]|uniref:hypothetical protein n=1 Tax=Streptomyces sp. CA2R101 TaxID=3120152 RepID=UPI0030091282